jgi:hypothetical protein
MDMARNVTGALPSHRAPHGVTALVAMTLIVAACSAAPVPSIPPPTATPSPSAALSPSPTASKPPIVKITPIPGAPDSGVLLKIVAASNRWDTSALNAPAAKIWHIELTNQERTVPHNFTVASGPAYEERIYGTPNVKKGTFRYDIPALPAGSYLFICTLHANTMTGTLTIR